MDGVDREKPYHKPVLVVRNANGKTPLFLSIIEMSKCLKPQGYMATTSEITIWTYVCGHVVPMSKLLGYLVVHNITKCPQRGCGCVSTNTLFQPMMSHNQSSFCTTRFHFQCAIVIYGAFNFSRF